MSDSYRDVLGLDDDELFFDLPLGGGYLVLQCDNTGCDHVRFLDDDGNELVYWNKEEWAEAPAEVMAAIMGCILGGAKFIRERLNSNDNLSLLYAR